jgi:hypothetical protein
MRAVIISLFMLFVASSLFAQIAINERSEIIIENRGELYFSFIKPKNISLDILSSIISIDKIDANNRVFAYANQQEFHRFLTFRIDYQIEKESYLKISPQMATSVSAFVQTWDAYPTYYQYDSLMRKLAADYPSICRFHILDTLPSGRMIMALQLGDSVTIHQKEVRFLYTSSMHGNELVGYVLMLRLAEYLLSNYGQNAEVDSIMNNVEIWINPLANPDGAYQAGNTTLAGATRYNSNFVDLNRNYPDPQKGPHPDGNVWQPETNIFMNFADSLHFSMSANFHGGAEVLNYPWDTWSKLPADVSWWRYVCHQYADTAHLYSPSNYLLGPAAANGTGVVNGYQWYPVFGGRQDYMNYYQACREVTIELSMTKLPQANTLNNFWNYNYRSMLAYINQARFGVQGIVRDSLTSKPLEAQIYINSYDKDSSQVFSHLPDGYYHRLLDSGYYSITYSAPHYYPKTIDSVYIARGQVLGVDVELAPDYTSLAVSQKPKSRIYPNPCSGQLNIVSEGKMKLIRLYAMDGHLVKQFDGGNVDAISIEIVGVEQGVYLLMIQDQKGQFHFHKLIIQ